MGVFFKTYHLGTQSIILLGTIGVMKFEKQCDYNIFCIELAIMNWCILPNLEGGFH